MLLAVFGFILLSNFMAVDSKIASQKNCLTETYVIHESFFDKAGAAPFSEGYEQPFDSTVCSFVPIHHFKDTFLFRCLFHTQLSLEKFDYSRIFFLENIAQKKLEGYFLFDLHKLLI